MLRVVSAALVALALFGGLAAVAGAQDWPAFENDILPDQHLIERGSGWNFAIWKIVLIIIPFLIWVKLADFVNRDALEWSERTEMPPELWNPIVVFSFLGGFILVITFPLFLLGLPLYLIAAFAPFAFYVVQRNSRVDPEETIFTKAHRQRRKERKLAGGEPVISMVPLPQDAGPAIDLKPTGVDPHVAQSNAIAARANPQYSNVKALFYESILRRSDQLLLDYTRDTVRIRQQIDGFWHELPARDRQSGDAMLVAMKLLAGVDPKDRKSRQKGSFSYSFPDHKGDFELVSQGVQTGERVLIKILGKKKARMDLANLGMLPSVEKKLKEYLNNPGYVVVSCKPGDGFTTSWNSVVSASDRMMRDFHAVVADDHDDTHVENVDINRFDPKDDKAAEKVLTSLRLKMPDAFVLPDPINGRIINALSEEVTENERFVISRVPAKSSAEAILRMLSYKPDRSKFAKALTAVVYSRLVRRLCDYCKQQYQPPPQLLQKLRLSVQQVPHLYREWQPPPPEELVDAKGRPIQPQICQVCGGIGYIGRIAIFDLVEVDDNIRRAIVNEPRLETVEAAIKASGNAGLQAAGLQIVIAGVTSLTELQRVLKG